MSREVHVRFCERRRVQFPPPTHLVIMVSGSRADAEALRETAAKVLAPLGLRLADAKTRVSHINDGIEFLGFRIQRQRKRGTQKRYVYILVSDKAIQSIRRKVKALTRRSWLGEDPVRHVLRINRMLRGWANYFQYATGKRVLSQLGWYARTRVCRWLRETHKGRRQMTWKEFKRRYIVPKKGLVVGGVTLFNPGSVPILRYLYRGTTIPTLWMAT